MILCGIYLLYVRNETKLFLVINETFLAAATPDAWIFCVVFNNSA